MSDTSVPDLAVVGGGVVGWLMGKAKRRSAAAHGSMDSERKPA